MRLWLSRQSDVPIREQLTTQIILGILCGELQPGQRLPSTRALARKFDVHPNTVSSGYQQLERDQWLEFRRGSGVYVRGVRQPHLARPECAPDRLIAQIIQNARELGIPLPSLRARLRQWLVSNPPDHFLVIEPEEHLRQIVIHELQQTLTLPVRGCAPSDCSRPEVLSGAIPVVLPSKSEMVRRILPDESDLLTLRVRSIPASLAKYLPAPASTLIGIASRWEQFLKHAHTVLIAAGFHPDSLVLRDARMEQWQRGLEKTSAVVCDSVVASQLPRTARAICFSLLSDESLNEVRRYQDFIRATDFRST